MPNGFISDFYKNTEIISPDDSYHYFFAYYDMRATASHSGNKHLCHRVSFMDRLPSEDDVCEIGYLENKKFYPIDTTTAWNFQQGAMLEYHPIIPDTVIYNVFTDGAFRTVIHNYVSGEKTYTDRATACHSNDGRYGLAVNFGRIFDFRPGYGYAGFIDYGKDICAPKDDGVFLTDLRSGTSELLMSYEAMQEAAGFGKDDKILVNHITFNRDSDRYVMLVRNFPKPGGWWSTSMVIGDLSGNIRTVLPNTYVSHYHWRDGRRIVAHCTYDGVTSMFEIDVDSGAATNFYLPYFEEKGNPDIHCNYSPDLSYIIGDGYPHDDYRSLLAYSIKTGKSVKLFSAYGPDPDIIDIRCDLHARFVYDGRAISYDTVHNGKRQIALVPTDPLNF
jgi:hypothetical protein